MKGHPVGTLVREDHPVDDHFPGSSVWLRIVRWVPRVGSHGGWLCVTSAAPGNVLCEEWDGDLREGAKFEDMPVVGAIPGSDADRAWVTEPTDLDPCYGNPVEQCTNPGHGRGPTAPTAEEEAIGDLRDHLGLPKHTPPSIVVAEAEVRAMPPTPPTIVTGVEAMRLPRGSRVVRVDGDGIPEVCAEVREIVPGHLTTRQRTLRYLVLYRAPDPVRTFAVGDVIATGDELESLPFGAVVRDEGGLVGQRLSTGWAWVDPTQNEIGPYGKATVVDLPGGDEA